MLTQMAQASVLMTSGDVISQKVLEGKQSVDWNRVARFGFMGTFFVVSFEPSILR